MHLKSNSHIGSIVISASLALAQRDNWTGEQLLKGIIGGYEAASMLGTAVQQSPGYNRHIRPSGICGAFGAAAAAVTATGASEPIAINALAFAANMASGFNEWAWAGGVEIYTEMGSASQAGVDAFELAKAGLQCSETVLEGRAGLFAALEASEGSAIFRERLKTAIGAGILDVRFKPVPGCNYAQTPLATALWIAQKHDLTKGIKSVSVDCTSGAKRYPGCDNPGPFSNVQQTKMSIQFGVCAVLLHGNVSEDVFAKFDSEEITAIAASCNVQASRDYEASFSSGRQGARVRVTLKDDSEVSEELTDVPWLDASAVRDRFRDEMGGLLGKENAWELGGLVERLDDLQSCDDIWKLFKC
jgi:2-methylcitrate dehydratase PrpD